MSKVPTVKSHNELTNQLINQILSNGAELFYHVGKIQIRLMRMFESRNALSTHYVPKCTFCDFEVSQGA